MIGVGVPAAGTAEAECGAAVMEVVAAPSYFRVTGSVSLKTMKEGFLSPPLSGVTKVSRKAPVTPS
jgi:hypothetical protein